MQPETPTMRADGPFTITTRRLDEGIVFALTGEVDLATAPIVEAELRRAEHSEDLVVLDLGEVSFMDSTGIRMVIAADQRLRERRARLRIVHVPRQVRRLFKLVGIEGRLEIDDGLQGEKLK